MAGPIRISVLANASQARRELNSVASDTSSLGGKLGRFGKAAGVAVAAGLAVAGAAAIKFGADSVKAASDAQQSLGATETVFGKFAGTVTRTSEQAATKYGLSANVYRENANLLGSLFKNQGVSMDHLGAKTEGMIATAADLSATFGGTTTEAVEALSGAFKGEYDMLERYGISLKQSDVNARLAAKGQDGLTGAALKAAEQQAKSALIAEQAAQANGAFARESNTLAHQQQVLGAQFDNLKAKVGAALLPVLTRLLTFVNANLIPGFNRLAEFLRPAVAWFKSLFDGVGQGSGRFAELSAFIQGRVVPAIQGVVQAFQGYLRVVIPIVRQVAQAVMSGWSQIQPQVRAIWRSVQNIITSALAIIRAVVQRVTGVVSAIWQRFGGTILRFITSTMKNVATVIRGAFQIVEGLFQIVRSALTGDWKGLWDGIKKVVSGAVSVVKGIVGQAWNVVRTVTSAAWTAVRLLVAKAWDGIKAAVTSGISGVVGFVRGLPGKVLSALGSLGSLLYGAGKDIIQGLLDGIESMIGAVRDKLSSLTKLIPDVKGPPSKDKVLLRKNGRLIIKGLIDGFADGEAGVKRGLGKLTSLIKKSVDLADPKKEARREKELLKRYTGRYKALLKNGRAQDALNDRLKEAREHLKDARKQFDDYAASVRSSAVTYAAVTGLDAAFNPKAIAAAMRSRLEKLRQFSEAIAQLRGAGLNQATLDQLVQGGVEGGLAYALAIQQGGAGAVAELNDLQAQVEGVAGQLGQTAAANMHSAGVAAAEGLVAGLEKAAAKLDKAAVRLANALVRAVKKALGIRSPSRVFRGLGDNVVQGLRVGLDDTYVRRSGAQLAASLEKGFGRPALEAVAGSAPGQGTAGATYQITVNAPVGSSPAEVGRTITRYIDAYERAGGRRAS